MRDEFRPLDKRPIEVTTDFLGEDRHEFVAKLAYKLWERTGAPSRFTGRRLVRGGRSCVRVVSSVGDRYSIPE